jgi:CxxC motif-containing protein (DUF1111 family)
MQLSYIALGAFVVTAALMQGQPGGDPQFDRGRALFDKPFALAEGLGAPAMNADSCRACHQDPVIGGAGSLELNVSLFGNDNGGNGPFTNLPGGPAVSKMFPPSVHGREEYPVGINGADVFEQRQTPSVLGNGLIGQISSVVITANEDVNDANNDGIFGVARRLTIAGNIEIGRFGWKAQVPLLADFVNDAMFNELGLTTPDNGRGFAGLTDADNVSDPEITQEQVDDIRHFIAMLPPPQRGGSAAPEVAEGQTTFQTIGCALCHTPSLASPLGPVPLFSNLLLHNVMPPDFRGMAEPGAASGFYRTPPLWGIKDTAPYMHDGRAEDLRGAILAHSGEAEAVRIAYGDLGPTEQNSLILFLEDL